MDKDEVDGWEIGIYDVDVDFDGGLDGDVVEVLCWVVGFCKVNERLKLEDIDDGDVVS